MDSIGYNNMQVDEFAFDLVLQNLRASLSDDVRFDLATLKGSWGYRNGKIYYDNINKYSNCVYEIARKCNIKFYQGNLYIFSGKIYQPIDKKVVRFAFSKFISDLGVISMVNDTKIYKQHFLDTIEIFNHLVPRSDVVAFTNGVLDLSDFTFSKHSNKFHCVYMNPYKYDPKAKCPIWNQFLKEVLPDKASRVILQMFLGLGLTERATVNNTYKKETASNVELCLLLVGTGSNGKSVIYNTARGIFGNDRISGADYNELTCLGDEGMRARRLLRGALFNWSSDSDVKHFGKRSGVFKKIVSGEPVTDREIGGNVEQNYHIPYLIFNVNDLPSPEDSSFGFIRRLQYISFENIIPANKQNKHLSQDLVQEYSGIFNWIVRGLKELKRRKYVFPDSEGSYRMLLKTMMKSNPVNAWISAMNIRPNANVLNEISCWIGANKLIESANTFSLNNNGFEITQQLFGATMNTHAFHKKRSSDGVYYQVFGFTEKDLFRKFNIEDDELTIEYRQDKGSFIDLDD